ncbi:MAG: GDP-mannose 4,6-dehydratase [Candidatus Omnitrophota bacterium]
MKCLITGISGFVGAHLVEALLAQGHSIVGIDAIAPANLSGVRFYQASLMDSVALKAVINDVAPERIIHLASASSVGTSWEKPVDCFVNNTNIFLNLVEAVRSSKVSCRILSVGSSEEYGPVTQKDLPLSEDRALYPMNPYAVARVAQEHLSRVYSQGYGLDIVCTRSFNHLGPGQSDRFVVSSFVRQAVEVSKGKRSAVTCGSLDIVRDFVDVRDVVSAYQLILDKGVSGGIYNVCSGRGVLLKDILATICNKVGVPASFLRSDQLIRPIDNPVIVGCNAKLKQLGFSPVYSLDRSLDDLIGWWREKA